MSNETTDALNNMYLNLSAEAEKINAEIAELIERRDEVAQQRAAVQIVIAEIEKDVAILGFEDSDLTAIFDEARPTKLLEEALIEIAEENNDVFNSYDHKEQLIDAGLLRGEPQAITQKLYQTLDGSERFEKNVEKGRWRLISDEEDLVF